VQTISHQQAVSHVQLQLQAVAASAVTQYSFSEKIPLSL